MDLPPLSWSGVLDNRVHLAIAFALSAPIAWDREREARGPGLRTFPLVAIGSCAFLLIGRTRFWIDLSDRSTSYLLARSNAVVAVKRAFDEAGITIPFPIRTLDFGDVELEGLSAKRAPSGGDGRDARAPADG